MDTNKLAMFVSHEFYAWHLLSDSQHKSAGLQLHYSYDFSFTILNLLSQTPNGLTHRESTW